MFLTSDQAKNEKSINSISDLWEILDLRLFNKFGATLTKSDVELFKVTAFKLFNSYDSFDLFNRDLKVLVAPTLNHYLKDRYSVPYSVSESLDSESEQLKFYAISWS